MISLWHFWRSKPEGRSTDESIAEGARPKRHQYADLTCDSMAVQVRRIKMPLPYGLNCLIREWRHPLHHPDDGNRAFLIYLSHDQNRIADHNIPGRGGRHDGREAGRLVAQHRG